MSVMDITNSSVINYCDEKCALSFNYPTSSTCIVTNQNFLFELSYDIAPTVTPVTFNNNKYNLNYILLYAPSIHLFDGKTVEAELIIYHTNSANPNNCLLICIPISSRTNTPSQLLSNIMNDIVDYTMNNGNDKETFIIQDYNLNNIIPKKPYYYYNQPTQNWDIVVYGLQYGIYIPEKTLTDISGYIKPFYAPVIIFPYESDIYLNNTGPGKSSDSGEIYIDCQPIDSSTETVEVVFKKDTNISGGGAGSASANNTTAFVTLTDFGLGTTTIMIIIVMFIIAGIYIALGMRNIITRKWERYKMSPSKLSSSVISKNNSNNSLFDEFNNKFLNLFNLYTLQQQQQPKMSKNNSNKSLFDDFNNKFLKLFNLYTLQQEK